jgi:hypothetical protein
MTRTLMFLVLGLVLALASLGVAYGCGASPDHRGHGADR